MARSTIVTHLKWILMAATGLLLAACASAPQQQTRAPAAQAPASEAPAPQAAERRAPPQNVDSATVTADQNDYDLAEPDGMVMVEADAGAEVASSSEGTAMMDAAAEAEAEARLEAELQARMAEEARSMETDAQVEAEAEWAAAHDQAMQDEYEEPVNKSTGDQATAPQWVVGKYEAKTDFLADVPELAGLDQDWGQVLTELVVEALQNRAQYSEGLTEQASREQLRQLAADGVSYYCDGDLRTFKIDRSIDGVAKGSLETVYKLRRVFGGRFLTVQREPLNETVEAPASADAEMLLNMSLRNVAVTIAERIVADIPADLAAIIN